MEKQKICAISNREDYICYKIKKESTYYDFLFSLLKEFDVTIPDLYEDNGKLPDILAEEDINAHYENSTFKMIEVIGHKMIFLIISTNLKEKLRIFMNKNCEFINIKNMD